MDQLRTQQKLIVYDAMVIYGHEDQDVAFAMHLVERLEGIKSTCLNIFVPERDLGPGTIQHAENTEIIRHVPHVNVNKQLTFVKVAAILKKM